MKGKVVSEINIGDKGSFEKTVSESDVYLYSGITGDVNPAHINKVYAEKTAFKERIAYGMLTAGFISTVLGSQLPGPGTIYLSQNLKFLKPVKFGDTIKAEVEVIEKNEKKNRITLKTTCKNQNDELVLDGQAEVMPPK